MYKYLSNLLSKILFELLFFNCFKSLTTNKLIVRLVSQNFIQSLVGDDSSDDDDIDFDNTPSTSAKSGNVAMTIEDLD